MLEAILCCLAFACIPLFAWLGLRDDRRRARAEAMPCRCLEIAGRPVVPAGRSAARNTPGDCP